MASDSAHRARSGARRANAHGIDRANLVVSRRLRVPRSRHPSGICAAHPECI